MRVHLLVLGGLSLSSARVLSLLGRDQQYADGQANSNEVLEVASPDSADAVPQLTANLVTAAESIDDLTGVGHPKTALAPINGPGFRSGISYSQYTADGQCRGADAVWTDVKYLISRGHDLIRIYGVDCNGPANVWNAVRGTGTAMFLGIWDINQADSQARSIAAQLGNDFSQVNTISVGNEVVNSGGSPGAVVAAMDTARRTLRSLGYNGPVVTTDTMVAVVNHPELCTESDYCAMNCHAFFDGNFAADQAGPFVKMFMRNVRNVIGGSKPIVITESGWPNGGYRNGVAQPGAGTQGSAIQSLKDAMPNNLILYSAFNEHWLHDNAGTFGTENYWGIYGDSPGGR